MKIKCIDNGGGKELTIGKEYEVIKEDREYYYVVSDTGIANSYYFKYRFEIVEELPEKWVLKHNNQQEMFDWLNLNSTNGITRYSGKILQYLYYPDLEGSHHFMRKDLSSGYKEISYETFEKLVLNKKTMEKKIIGYNVKDLKYVAAYKALIPEPGTRGREFGEPVDVSNPNNIAALKKEGVLDMWFTPVYEEEQFKVGDYVVMEKAGGWGYSPDNNGCVAIITKIGKRRIDKIGEDILCISGNIINPKVNGNISFTEIPVTNSEGERVFRQATPEEVEEAKKKAQITIGSYTMKIKNGKAVFGCQEFTKQELLAYKRLFNRELKGAIWILELTISEELLDKIIAQL